jgi:hypothetical protein
MRFKTPIANLVNIKDLLIKVLAQSIKQKFRYYLFIFNRHVASLSHKRP